MAMRKMGGTMRAGAVFTCICLASLLLCARVMAGEAMDKIVNYSGPSQVERGGETYDVFKYGSKYTDLQREKVFKEIKGKIVVWDCEVYEVSKGEAENEYIVVCTQERRVVPCIIFLTARNQNEIARIEELKTGSRIKITGIIQDIAFRNIQIEPAVFADGKSDGSLEQTGRTLGQVSDNASTPRNNTDGSKGADKSRPYNENALRDSYRQCLDKSDGITAKVNECVHAESEYWESRLNAAYKALMEKLDPEAQKSLTQAERTWLNYRYRYSTMEGAGGGTAGNLNGGNMYLMETMKQTLLLEGSLAPYK